MSKESMFFVKRQQFPSINNNVCIDSEHAEHVHCVCALCVCVPVCFCKRMCMCVGGFVCVWEAFVCKYANYVDVSDSDSC